MRRIETFRRSPSACAEKLSKIDPRSASDLTSSLGTSSHTTAASSPRSAAPSAARCSLRSLKNFVSDVAGLASLFRPAAP